MISVMKKLVILLLFIGCQHQEPPNYTSGKLVSTPEEQGISSESIIRFIDAMEKEQPNALHSLIIQRHGAIVAEGYWAPYDSITPHSLYSLSKSFTSSAIGLAIEEEIISLDDQVISFFPDQLPDTVSNNLKNMRIRDLLTYEYRASKGWKSGIQEKRGGLGRSLPRHASRT